MQNNQIVLYSNNTVAFCNIAVPGGGLRRKGRNAEFAIFRLRILLLLLHRGTGIYFTTIAVDSHFSRGPNASERRDCSVFFVRSCVCVCVWVRSPVIIRIRISGASPYRVQDNSYDISLASARMKLYRVVRFINARNVLMMIVDG